MAENKWVSLGLVITLLRGQNTDPVPTLYRVASEFNPETWWKWEDQIFEKGAASAGLLGIYGIKILAIEILT